MRITNLIRKTAGGRHGWYMTDMGIKVRKPLQGFVSEEIGAHKHIEVLPIKAAPEKKNIWQRFIHWLRATTKVIATIFS